MMRKGENEGDAGISRLGSFPWTCTGCWEAFGRLWCSDLVLPSTSQEWFRKGKKKSCRETLNLTSNCVILQHRKMSVTQLHSKLDPLILNIYVQLHWSPFYELESGVAGYVWWGPGPARRAGWGELKDAAPLGVKAAGGSAVLPWYGKNFCASSGKKQRKKGVWRKQTGWGGPGVSGGWQRILTVGGMRIHQWGQLGKREAPSCISFVETPLQLL